MNSHPSPIEHMDVERRSSSPKRKKVRQKYAPKACKSRLPLLQPWLGISGASYAAFRWFRSGSTQLRTTRQRAYAISRLTNWCRCIMQAIEAQGMCSSSYIARLLFQNVGSLLQCFTCCLYATASLPQPGNRQCRRQKDS
jgi:hypothetical protein